MFSSATQIGVAGLWLGTALHPMTWLGVHRCGKWLLTEIEEKPIEHLELYFALGLGMSGTVTLLNNWRHILCL